MLENGKRQRAYCGEKGEDGVNGGTRTHDAIILRCEQMTLFNVVIASLEG